MTANVKIGCIEHLSGHKTVTLTGSVYHLPREDDSTHLTPFWIEFSLLLNSYFLYHSCLNLYGKLPKIQKITKKCPAKFMVCGSKMLSECLSEMASICTLFILRCGKYAIILLVVLSLHFMCRLKNYSYYPRLCSKKN